MIKSIVNINGDLFPPSDAKISIFDRGFLFGDSVYEVTRSYDGVIFLLEEHLNRLWNSARLLSMTIPWSKEQLKDEIKKAIKHLKLKNVYIRLIVTRGEGEINLDPQASHNHNFIIIVKEQKDNPSWWYDDGVSLHIPDVMRNPQKALDPNIKSGNYLNNVMALIKAKEKNAFDAVMLNKDGMITECSVSNIWMIKNNEIVTPPISAGILKGITRETLLNLIKKNELKFSERNFTADEIKNADECFLSSSTREVVPVTKIDEQEIGNGLPGTLTKKLIALYRQNIEDYKILHKADHGITP